MKLPILQEAFYANITNAKNLKGKLLLTHGGLDDNVNPSATFKLAEALIKADKDFDLVILPSQRHGYTGVHRLYFMKKRWNTVFSCFYLDVSAISLFVDNIVVSNVYTT